MIKEKNENDGINFNNKIGKVNILFTLILIAVFIILSIILFNHRKIDIDSIIVLYSLSVLFFILGILGLLMKRRFYAFVYKFGAKLLSRSDEYSFTITKVKEKDNKKYTLSFISISFILLIIAIVIIVFN